MTAINAIRILETWCCHIKIFLLFITYLMDYLEYLVLSSLIHY